MAREEQRPLVISIACGRLGPHRPLKKQVLGSSPTFLPQQAVPAVCLEIGSVWYSSSLGRALKKKQLSRLSWAGSGMPPFWKAVLKIFQRKLNEKAWVPRGCWAMGENFLFLINMNSDREQHSAISFVIGGSGDRKVCTPAESI